MKHIRLALVFLLGAFALRGADVRLAWDASVSQVNRWLAILILFACLRAGGATHYIDNAATGANNGTSWADAWTSTDSISWTAGDTYYISGGTTSKTYTNSVIFGASGTSGNRITFSVSDDAGHSGFVFIDGGNVEGKGGVLSINSRDYITVIGGTGTAPTNNFQVDSGATKITDNIRLWFVNAKSAAGSSGAGIYLSGTPNDITIQNVGVSNVTRNLAGGQSAHGVWLNMTGAGAISNLVFRQLYISHTDDDGFQSIGNDPSDTLKAEVAFSWIAYTGDDGLEVNHGWTIRDNVIGPARFVHGHPDGIQSNGSTFRIYNNRFYDFFNSCMRLQSSILTNWHNVWAYNNLIIPRAHPGGSGFVQLTNVVIEIAQYAIGPGELSLQTWSNIYVMNNTVYLTNAAITGGNISWSKREEGSVYFHNVVLTNSLFVNNLFVTRLPQNDLGNGGGISWQQWENDAPWGTKPTHSTESANIVDWNTIASDGAGVGQKAITYFGVNHSSGESMAASSSIWKQNKSTFPAFISEGVDFDLRGTDTAALKRGTNLSPLFAFDILNRARGATWRRGAFDPQDVVIHLDFESHVDASDSITNLSGLGVAYNGKRFGYTNSTPAGSNFPNRVSASSTSGTNGSTWAGQFDWYADGHGVYGRSGDYIGFTNMHRLTNMSAATIMFRGRYRNHHAGEDYTSDANAQFLSAGSAVNTNLGGWDFGRWNQAINNNETRFIIATNSNQSTPQVGSEGDRFFGKAGRLVCNFPDGYAPIVSDTTNWAHYAITFNLGTIVAYYNGSPIGTNDISGVISNLTLGARWLCVGCNTHTGQEPYLDDGASPTLLPNNGWLNGDMDDLFIYDRALTASEICAASGFGNCASVGVVASVGRVGRLKGIRLR